MNKTTGNFSYSLRLVFFLALFATLQHSLAQQNFYPGGYPFVDVNGTNSPSGNYQFFNRNPISVSIESSFPDAQIFYSMDGSAPDAGSIPYSGPFQVTPPAIIRAVAFTADFFTEVDADPVALVYVPTYTVTNETPGGGSVAFDPPGGSYLSNKVVTVTATGAAGWTFKRWDGDVSGTSAAVSLQVDGPKKVKAIFDTSLTATVTGSPPGGEARIWPATHRAEYGSVATVSGVPAAGKYFFRWSVAGNSSTTLTNSPLRLTVTTPNPTVTALFSSLPAGQFALGIEVAGDGDLEPTPRLPYYPAGSIVSLQPIEKGMVFGSWDGAASGRAIPLQLTMDGNKLIRAIFTDAPKVFIIGIAEGQILKPNGGVTLGVTAYDGDSLIQSVEFFVNGESVYVNAVEPFAGQWTPTLPGPYTLTAVATDQLGGRGTSAPVHVVVKLPPEIFQQPVSQRVPMGGAASFAFTVGVNGDDLLFQWQHNGTNLPYETSSALYLGRVTEANNGTYQAFITNQVGHTSSELVTLTVVPPGGILQTFPNAKAAGTPAVARDGSIIVQAYSSLRCYGPDGATNWQFGTVSGQVDGPGTVSNGPVLGADETVFVAVNGAPVGLPHGCLYALDSKTGISKWPTFFGTGGVIFGMPAIGTDGAIFIGTDEGKVIAISPETGTKRWEFNSTNSVLTDITVGLDGSIYFVDLNSNLYSLTADGTLKWVRPFGHAMGAIAPGLNGLIYYLVPGNALVAIDAASGDQRATFSLLSAASTDPAVGPDGTVYIQGRVGGSLIALDGLTLTQKWASVPFEGRLTGTPIIAANGFIYAIDFVSTESEYKSTLRVFDSMGSTPGLQVRSVGLAGVTLGAPVLSKDNLIYFVAGDGSLVEYVSDAPPADSPWPMWRKSAGNHGNAAGIPGDFKFQRLTENNPNASPSADSSGRVWAAYDAQLREYIGSTNLSDGTHWIDHTPVVGPSGRIFIATIGQPDFTQTLLAIYDPSQNKYVAEATVPGQPPGYATLALGPDETMYVGTTTETNCVLYSWHEGSSPKALTNFNGKIDFPLAIGSDGALLVPVAELTGGLYRGVLYKVRTDGTVVGAFHLQTSDDDTQIFGGPVIAGDGTIYISDLPSSIWALTPDLQLKWALTGPSRLGYRIDSSLAIGPDGTLYVPYDENIFSLMAVNPDGTLKWTQPFRMPEGRSSYSSLAVGEDKTIYLSGGLEFYAVRDAGDHGELAWKYPLPGVARTSPLLTADGNLYVSCDGATFLSLKASSGPANSPWSMFRGNAQRTGSARLLNDSISISITQPAEGASFTDADGVTMTVSAFDGKNPITKVEYFDGATLVATATASPFSATNQFAVGEHALTAKATDAIGVSAVSAPVHVTISAATIFKWAQAGYSAGESDGFVQLTVNKTGPAGRVNYATHGISAEEGRDFTGASGTLDFAAGVGSQTVKITLLDDFVPDGPKQFEVELTASSANSYVATPSVATVTIADNDASLEHNSFLEFGFPSERPASRGSLQVFLVPSAAGGQWRFPWELLWRNSGDIASDLDPGDYAIEFRPVAGFAKPDDSLESVPGGAAVVRTKNYVADTTLVGGTLTVQFSPLDLLGGASVPGWRFVGETTYHLNGEVISNVPAGVQVVEFRPVTGWTTPTAREVLIQGGLGTALTIGYVLSSTPAVGIATPTPFPSYAAIHDGILSSPRQPYSLVGQLRSAAGFGSGIAVRDRVVLTAAHVLFDEATLDFVGAVDWFGARQAGEYAPRPVSARGWYVNTNYVTARRHERNDLGLSPGVTTTASEQWDVAAIYFDEPVSRGGFSGYLLSDSDANEWLISPRQKELLGYPLSGGANDGKMHYILPGNYTFAQDAGRVFSTAQFLSYPGNSGGPISVQFTRTDAQVIYFPAAVYLGTRNNRSIARAIDSDVASLINRAASSAALGTNFVGGGVIGVGAGGGFGSAQFVHLTVQISPAAAVAAGAGWRVKGSQIFSQSGASVVAPAGDIQIEFSAATGFATLPTRTVTLVAGQDTTVPVTYIFNAIPAQFDRIDVIGNTLRLRVHRATAGTVALERSSDLRNWTTLRNLDLPAGTAADFDVALPGDHAGYLRINGGP